MELKFVSRWTDSRLMQLCNPFLREPIERILDSQRSQILSLRVETFRLKALETLIIPGPPKIVFVGIAKAADAEAWRRAAATVVRRIKSEAARNFRR